MKKHKKIIFGAYGDSHKKGSEERVIKTVVAMTRTMLMHVALRCPEETLSNDIFQMVVDHYI